MDMGGDSDIDRLCRGHGHFHSHILAAYTRRCRSPLPDLACQPHPPDRRPTASSSPTYRPTTSLNTNTQMKSEQHALERRLWARMEKLKAEHAKRAAGEQQVCVESEPDKRLTYSAKITRKAVPTRRVVVSSLRVY